jgi:hypothetical protein
MYVGKPIYFFFVPPAMNLPFETQTGHGKRKHQHSISQQSLEVDSSILGE